MNCAVRDILAKSLVLLLSQLTALYDKVHRKLKIGVPHGSDAKFSTKMTVFDAVKNHEITL